MKKLLFILFLFLCAFSFLSVMPPGWVQLTLPINDEVGDIYFTDTLNGWAVMRGNSSNGDTGHIIHTSNGGLNWDVQYTRVDDFVAVQFIDTNVGYAFGGWGFSKFYKTINGGTNWQDMSTNIPIYASSDMQFLNKDTGWITSSVSILGGLAKTTNGGLNWVQQLDNTYSPKKLFFINADTGWVLGSSNNLYRTTNGGNNWSVQYSFPTGMMDFVFVNRDSGWAIRNSANGIFKTTNGGINWINSGDPFPSNSGLNDIFFVNSKKGWIATYAKGIFSINSDGIWGIQQVPSGTASYNSVFAVDTNLVFAGGTKMIKTTDGGGPVLDVEQVSTEIPDDFKLYQNYPNPFNPKTVISYQCSVSGFVNLAVYDISGRVISILVDKKQSSGTYQYNFDGSDLPSGIYFYSLQTESFTDVKKMVLVK